MPSIDNVQDITPRIQYVASAAQTDFDYPFPVFDEDDIVVDVDGATKTITTHYTVDGVGEDTGGTITFLSGMVGGEIVTIYRDMAIERLTDFQQHGPYSSDSFNDELDRITLILQELKSNQGRSLRFAPAAEVTDTQTLFSPLSSWLSKFIFINADGEPEPATGVTGSVLSQSTVGAALYPQTAAELAAGVTPTNYYYEPGNVLRYGTNTTPGTTDMTAAIQAAHDGLPSAGGVITVPGGTYAQASEINFTKPVVLIGDGRGVSMLIMTSNALNRDAIQTSNSIRVHGLTIKTQTAPVTDLAMCGIRADVTSNTGVTVDVDGCEILDFCFPVFADGRGAGGQSFNIERGIVRNCTLRVSSLAGATASCFLSGSRLGVFEYNDIDNQDLGDHNIYMIRNFNNVVRGNRLRNTAATQSLCAVKMVTELAGDSGTLGVWSVENNSMESNSLPIFVSITGSIVLPLLSISGNSIKTARSTTAGDSGAILLSASNTATYRTIKINDIEISDVQLGGILFSAAAGATFKDMWVNDIRLFDFSKASSGTYSALGTDSLGTYENLLIGNMTVDGNSTGRQALNVGSATYVNVFGDIKEVNCTNSSVGSTKIGRGSGVQKLTWNATASVADGGTITHSLGTTPTAVLAMGTVASEFVSVTALSSTTFTVAIKKHDNTAGTSQTIYWAAIV